jgi:hypothetical protein
MKGHLPVGVVRRAGDRVTGTRRVLKPDRQKNTPVNCDNTDIQRYCIGQDQCPYSIWGDLPFSDEMYEQVEKES